MKNVKKESCLRLEVDGFKERMVELLREIETDPELRREFVDDPASVLSERVTGNAAGRHQLSEVNRLVFAILANDDLVKWLNEYEDGGKRLSKEEFASAFAKKLGEVDQGTVIGSILSNAAVGNGLPGYSTVANQCAVRETCGKQSAVCTPVSKSNISINGNKVDPNTIRSLSEALIQRAKDLQQQGVLGDLSRLL